jgi:hypothetical protein
MRRGRNGARDDERLNGRLVAVAVLGFVLFVPPLLAAFDRPVQVLGVPLLWAYLMLAWAVVIGLVATLVRRSG